MKGLEKTGLPLLPYLPEISRLLAERCSLVLSASPGAGKTSLVPPYLAQEGCPGGAVLLVEPRRVAAVGAATRIAELLGEGIGRSVGYRVRGDSRGGRSARIVAMTEGVLLRTIQDDPSLAGVGCVILDEFHERSATADLCLALLVEARALRPDLKLLVMSATIDVSGIASYLGAASIEAPGRAFPVQTRHVAVAEGPGFEERLAALAPGLAAEADGDVLVFLPGAAEIGRAARSLQGSGLEILPLHGSLSLDEQRRVVAPPGGDERPAGARRRVILATSVAETSLTVPRVRAVVDCGLARLTRFHVRSGLNRLVTERESADRADQRRGRAGRLGPGLCLRAWPAGDILPARVEPEIRRAELSSLALESAVWGARGRTDLPWLEAPPEPAWEAATELLGELGALDRSGAPTEFGRRMALLGTEPRLAALVIRGARSGDDEGRAACLLAALLSERDASGERDLESRIASLASSDRSDRRNERVLREAERLAAAAGMDLPEKGAMRTSSLCERERPFGLGRLLAAAFPDRIGKRIEYRGPSAVFRLPSGRSLSASGSLAQSSWIVAAEADAGAAEGRVYAGAALGEADALAALEPSMREELAIEWKGMSYRARRQRRAGAIVLRETAAGALGREEVARALAGRVAAEGIGILPWGEGPGSATAFLARFRYWARASRPATPPAARTSERDAEAPRAFAALADDAALAAWAEEWLCPFVGAGPDEVLDGASLRRALEAMLDRATRARLDRDAPERLRLPSGAERAVDYSGTTPTVEGRVQEFFGLSEQPFVLGQAVLLRLLTPAGRPLQVTADLPGFWRGSWAEARKELRGRYPKHEWPEDPARAAPSVRGLKTGGKRR